MFSMFRDMETAVAYLCVGLGERYHGATMKISWSGSKLARPTAVVATMEELQPTLKHLCRRFPDAAVVLEPATTSHALLAAIQCRCPTHIRQACEGRCRHRDEMPIACIEVCAPENPPSNEPNIELLSRAQDKLHDYSVEDKRKSDSPHHKGKERHTHHAHRH